MLKNVSLVICLIVITGLITSIVCSTLMNDKVEELQDNAEYWQQKYFHLLDSDSVNNTVTFSAGFKLEKEGWHRLTCVFYQDNGWSMYLDDAKLISVQSSQQPDHGWKWNDIYFDK